MIKPLNSLTLQYLKVAKFRLIELVKRKEEKEGKVPPKLNSKSKDYILHYINDTFKKPDYVNIEELMKIENPNANKRMNFSKMGLKPMTEEEMKQQELLHDKDYYNPFEGKKPMWVDEKKQNIIYLQTTPEKFSDGIFCWKFTMWNCFSWCRNWENSHGCGICKIIFTIIS